MTNPLPRNSDGDIQTSAEYGMGLWFVEVQYNTDFDNRVIDPETEEYPRTLHGTFTSSDEAEEWMDNYGPDSTDIHEIRAFQLNAVRPVVDLHTFEALASDDEVKTDLKLTHTTCGEHLCDIQHGDEMIVLLGVVEDHTCGVSA